MKKIVVSEKYNNKKLNSFILDTFSNLNQNVYYKALRQKDIKVNGKRVKENVNILKNDIIEIYISDELLLGQEKVNLDVIYEDDNIIAIYKPINISVTDEADGNNISLTKIVKDKFGSNLEPCHRLDRNTKGIILFAKNQETLNIMFDKFKNHEVEKHYLATVYGIPKIEHDILKAYLFKDRKNNLVYVSNIKKPGYLEIITEYTLLNKNIENNTSVLDVNLHTGRTHQIRAHLAYNGYPIIGDGKYGNSEINKKFVKKVQELESYKIIFKFNNDSGILNYLKDKEIKIK